MVIVNLDWGSCSTTVSAFVSASTLEMDSNMESNVASRLFNAPIIISISGNFMMEVLFRRDSPLNSSGMLRFESMFLMSSNAALEVLSREDKIAKFASNSEISSDPILVAEGKATVTLLDLLACGGCGRGCAVPLSLPSSPSSARSFDNLWVTFSPIFLTWLFILIRAAACETSGRARGQCQQWGRKWVRRGDFDVLSGPRLMIIVV
mmetsp:Transcript_30140/g.63557  ORF Transcript_30140/g.63557 Transcript_30140/m.63557 type:complete len:207 (+) Transcript_30140:295-915(+)